MQTVNLQIHPEGRLEILSKKEVSQLLDTSASGLHELFRRCSLAVLNCGSHVDDSRVVLDKYRTFDVRVIQQARGIKLDLLNAPSGAFVDGEMIRGIREHLFSVLRDIVYTNSEIVTNPAFDLGRTEDISNAVFHILRNAGSLIPQVNPNLVVCWGGHSISRDEYEYTKEVGHELGLRGIEVCTGCGPGAMKGPMKGATIGHAKQRIAGARYVGLTEPGIIAAEPPNPIVNELVILPDIEKRLEAFVRLGHGIVVFPGGAGTAEEIFYLLGILLHPDNTYLPFPLVLTGPAGSAAYFRQIDAFLAATVGPEVRRYYRIIVGDPAEVAREMKQGVEAVRQFRRHHHDAYYFNWLLKIEHAFQTPFEPSHENMGELELHRDQPPHLLAAHLRRAFSGIVAGNVKAEGIRAIEERGPFELKGDPAILKPLDELLSAFVAQGRMKLPGSHYEPCYRLNTGN
ncbi:nucleotide 5'-monophosphate nucleosidase PpnN [Methylococcus sp. EFPC2]|uniref:nucleotide 5'-monophosphate nucleosidase PpnN n=1 Tax=Methylococcus sp. EFPC2 TaxID=2812648 RepID=UPI001967963B|nr:nucleotide 5'-monophosphate nucleosidase PpnN [Methylococcus sp. EFPC2]QSA96256.1 LOG family protein [Methylococcus sp. EFPC2]